MHCEGFDNQSEAYDVGKKIQLSLLLACLKREIFIDIGKGKASIFLSESVKQMMWEKHKVQYLEEIHGVQVYDVNKKTQFARGPRHGVKIHLLNYAEDVLADITKFLSKDIKITNRDLLALELYNASDFETSPRASFLTLMLATETLLESATKSIKTQSVIDDISQHVLNSDIEKGEKDALITGIKNMKQQSFKWKGEKLATTYLSNGKKYHGLSPEKFFSKCYNIRGKLVHSGHFKTDIGPTLEVFVRDLLVNKLINPLEIEE